MIRLTSKMAQFEELPPTPGIADLADAGLESLPTVLTIPETAKILRIGRNSAYEAARRGQIPTIKIGKRLLVPRNALERLLAGAKGDKKKAAPQRKDAAHTEKQNYD